MSAEIYFRVGSPARCLSSLLPKLMIVNVGGNPQDSGITDQGKYKGRIKQFTYLWTFLKICRAYTTG